MVPGCPSVCLWALVLKIVILVYFFPNRAEGSAHPYALCLSFVLETHKLGSSIIPTFKTNEYA